MFKLESTCFAIQEIAFPCTFRYTKGTLQQKRAGTDLADGYFGILFSLVGDLDYFMSVLDLPNSRSLQPCVLCKARKHAPNSWQDFRPNADWMGTMYTPEQWLAWDNKPTCPLFRLPNVTGLNVAYDWLHCKYLGSDQYMYAALLMLLCYHMLPGTPEANIRALWQDIQTVYREQNTPVRFRYLNTLRMFVRLRGPPKLRGKGSEIKYLAGPMLRVWEKYMNAALQLHRDIRLMLQLNSMLETLLIEHRGDVSLGEDAERFSEATHAFLLLLSKVSRRLAEDGGDVVMSVTEKNHFLQHSAMWAQYISPRLLWAFSGEDQQRRVQTLGKASVKGLGPSRAILKMVSRYRVALHFQFRTHD